MRTPARPKLQSARGATKRYRASRDLSVYSLAAAFQHYRQLSAGRDPYALYVSISVPTLAIHQAVALAKYRGYVTQPIKVSVLAGLPANAWFLTSPAGPVVWSDGGE